MRFQLFGEATLNIQGNKVTLRAIEREDLPALQRWANDPSIQEMLGGWRMPTSMNDQAQWYAGLSINSLNQRFVIEAPDRGLIGTANLTRIDWKNRNAFYGVMLGDKANHRCGFGTDTVMAIMRYAFDELGLMRLDTDIIEYNEPSLILHRKTGWLEEGRKKNWYFRKDRFWDKVIMGITSENYQALIAKTHYWNSPGSRT